MRVFFIDIKYKIRFFYFILFTFTLLFLCHRMLDRYTDEQTYEHTTSISM